MAFATTPRHGKYAAVYRLRPNGFKGDGLNDLTWGTGYSGGGSSGYFEVVIDGAGTPDTFKWRKNGGGWTETVAITGAAQTLSDSLTITFAATTGHTATDQWMIGNLDTEATTESGATAQITEATYRLTRPNKLTWTDSGGETVIYQENANGKATFSGNVTTVTVSGNNSFYIPSALEKVGYLNGWNLSLSVDLADSSRQGQHWKESAAGQGSGAGSCNSYFIGSDSFLNGLKEQAEDANEAFFIVEFYLSDPDADQTGDMFRAWVQFSGISLDAPLGGVGTEGCNFSIFGMPSLIAAT